MPRKTRRTSAYWEGVKDALQLVHNFLDYHEDHPDESADIRAFVLKSIKKAHVQSTPRLKAELDISFHKEGLEKEKVTEAPSEEPLEEPMVDEEEITKPSIKDEEEPAYKPILGPEPPPLEPEPIPEEKPAITEPEEITEPETPSKPGITTEIDTETEVSPKPERDEIEEKELPTKPSSFTIKIEKPQGLEFEVKREGPSKPSEVEPTKTMPELSKLLGLDFRRDSDEKKPEKKEDKAEEEKSDPEPFI